MNRIFRFYAVCIALLSGLFGSTFANATERVAPTLPESVFTTYVNEGEYFLFNVERNEILSVDPSNNSYYGCGLFPVKIKIQERGDYISLENLDRSGNSYLDHNSQTDISNYSYHSSFVLWSIYTLSNGEYKFQRSEGASQYNESLYMGFNRTITDKRAYPGLDDTNCITWKLIDGSQRELVNYFAAKQRLFVALERTNSTGFNVDKYDSIYSSTSSTAEEMLSAAIELETALNLSTTFSFPSWNEYPVLISNETNEWRVSSSWFNAYIPAGSSNSIDATVFVDKDATLCFKSSSTDFNLNISVDGILYESYNRYDQENDKRRFVELTPGLHTVSFNFENYTNSSSYANLREICVRRSEMVEVSLLEPGSLGTEILYADGINRVQDVRKLKISGTMNDEDWRILDMVKNELFVLDLSEANITTTSNERFSRLDFLHTIILPEGLNSIGSYAFYQSPLVNVHFPSTLQNIGYMAFGHTGLKEAILPEGCELGSSGSQFSGCKSLRNVILPTTLTRIPTYAFSDCSQLSLEIPEGVKRIENDAFENCYSMNTRLPNSLEYIGDYAFVRCNGGSAVEGVLNIPDNVSYIGRMAFDRTAGYHTAILPVCIAQLNGNDIIPASVTTIKLKSATVVNPANKQILADNLRSGITLVVPDYLVASYKLDSYWYNFGNIIGFDTSEVDSWNIRNDLVLGARDRFRGNPSITMHAFEGGLKINGTEGMDINNLDVYDDWNQFRYGRIFSNADNVVVNGYIKVHEYFNANKWYYISLPYNVSVADITSDVENAKKAIRYYDGANRAENGTGNNWVNFAADAVIPAGTGFIFQSSVGSWWHFPAMEDESKQYLTSNRLFAKELAANPSETVTNRGWNLVGNPYQTWYNIHKINFSAPITVRNLRNDTYEAYSIIDDDYALAPNQAFFVQCPEGTNEITFPLNGRQLTSVITDQNGAPARDPQFDRVLVDLLLSQGDICDRTRVVLNQKASTDYEMERDASKFLSEASVAQIYSLDAEGNQYAINERPMMDGDIQLGIIIPESGTYTFSLQRNMADAAYIIDRQTGATIDITYADYDFQAEAGTDNGRFILRLQSAIAAGIEENTAAQNSQTDRLYNIAGQKVGRDYKGIVINNGKKVIVK